MFYFETAQRNSLNFNVIYNIIYCKISRQIKIWHMFYLDIGSFLTDMFQNLLSGYENNNILIDLIKIMLRLGVYSDIPTFRRSGIIIAP